MSTRSSIYLHESDNSLKIHIYEELTDNPLNNTKLEISAGEFYLNVTLPGYDVGTPRHKQESTTMASVPEYADLITIDDFADLVILGAFIDYDGTGYYATETEMSREIVSCSIPFLKKPGYTHVAWFNR